MIKQIISFILTGLLLMQVAFADITVVSGGSSTVLAGHASDNIVFQVIDDKGHPSTEQTVNFKVVNPLGDQLTEALLHDSAKTDNDGKVTTLVKGDHTIRLGNYTVTATDNCDGALTPTLTAGLASGATFPVGTTDVSYTVADAVGNGNNCTFSVTIEDNTPPVLTCPQMLFIRDGHCSTNDRL